MSFRGPRGRARRTVRWAGALALSAVLVSACSKGPPPAEVLRPVRSQKVLAMKGSRSRSFSGIARAGLETELSFRVPGTVERLDVKVGDAVRKGSLIARLDPGDYEIRVRQARADLARAEARARNAEADLERVRGMWENRDASQNDYDAARAQAESADAEVESAAEALKAAERQLGYAELGAPVDGSIAAVDVEVNENVRQGQRVVLLTSGTRPEVEVAIPEILIAQVREGDPVAVTFDALPGARFAAVVTEVGVAATGTATTFPVTVRLAEPSGEVRSGMAADVEFSFESADHRERVYLPSHAVGGDRDGRFVFVLEPTDEPGVGVVRRVAVEAGELTGDGLEILSGISEGQDVVTAGVRRLSDGQRVKILAPEPAR